MGMGRARDERGMLAQDHTEWVGEVLIVSEWL